MCTLPNFLILEHLEGDVPQRYTVMKGTPEVTGNKSIPASLPSAVRHAYRNDYASTRARAPRCV